MTEWQAKQQLILDLLDAQVNVKKIMNIVKCSSRLVYKVKNLRDTKECIARKAGSGVDTIKSGIKNSSWAWPLRLRLTGPRA